MAAFASVVPLHQATAPTAVRQSRLWHTAEEFEGVLIARLLRDMQATRFGPNGLSGASSSVYQGMLDNQFAGKIASRDPFGIARLLVEQLGGTKHSTPSASQVSSHAVQTYRRTAAPQRVAAAGGIAAQLPQARRFAIRVMPLLVPAARRLHTTPQSLLAQAALETGWGRYLPRTRNGADSHNIFGIKTGSTWRGASAIATTREYQDASWHRNRAAFRAYPDLQAAVTDFVHVAQHLLSGLGHGAVVTAERWGEFMGQVDYATDPGYGAKLAAIAHGPLMQTVLAGLGVAFKSGTNVPFSQSHMEGDTTDAPR